jgi:GMP synthase (glutamine-hydrolysing)
MEVGLLVIMGGPMNVYEELKYPWLTAEKRFIAEAISLGRPILGVCLGAQLLAAVMGARVAPNAEREIGWFNIYRTDEADRSGLAGFLPERAEVFHWHGDTFDMPAGAVHFARSTGCEHQGFVAHERIVGLQFHLELTADGAGRLIQNCPQDLETPGRFVQTPVAILSNEHRFGQAHALLASLLDSLSGKLPNTLHR